MKRKKVREIKEKEIVGSRLAAVLCRWSLLVTCREGMLNRAMCVRDRVSLVWRAPVNKLCHLAEPEFV